VDGIRPRTNRQEALGRGDAEGSLKATGNAHLRGTPTRGSTDNTGAAENRRSGKDAAGLRVVLDLFSQRTSPKEKPRLAARVELHRASSIDHAGNEAPCCVKIRQDSMRTERLRTASTNSIKGHTA
jgi:hypothetical protein